MNAMKWAIVLLSVACFCVPETHATQEAGSPLETLAYKTGWIDLGEVLTRDSKTWATASSPTFEIVGKAPSPKVLLPKRGERIRLITRLPIILVDFASLGEANRLTAPLRTHHVGPGDQTGLFLEVGTIVEVRAIEVSRPSGFLRFVWARVVPAAQ